MLANSHDDALIITCQILLIQSCHPDTNRLTQENKCTWVAGNLFFYSLLFLARLVIVARDLHVACLL
jgi:hypothetical protein